MIHGEKYHAVKKDQHAQTAEKIVGVLVKYKCGANAAIRNRAHWINGNNGGLHCRRVVQDYAGTDAAHESIDQKGRLIENA